MSYAGAEKDDKRMALKIRTKAKDKPHEIDATLPRIELQPGYSISRVIKGGWQLAGGHGPVDEDLAVEGIRSFVREGITTIDCADIYTGVEEIIGKFIQKNKSALNSGDLPPIQIHTKYVPDLER